MITTSSRLLARRADEAATAALRVATTLRGDDALRSAAFEAALGADDAAVLALTGIDGDQDLEAHVRAALAHAEAVHRLSARAAS